MSSSTPSTACTGVRMKASSAGSARSRRLGTTGRPNAPVARGWTAVSGPAKPVVAQLATMNLAQPELSDAPTSAMLCGAKNARSRSGVTSSRAAPWSAGPGSVMTGSALSAVSP